MAKGLKCLISDNQIKARIKTALNNIATLMISKNPSVKITAKEVYNQLRSHGVDIDLQSTAALYSEAFATSIGQFSNFETEAELQAYATQTVPLSPEVKDALIKGGFGKTLSNGKVILDWVNLMRKSEDDIKLEVSNAIAASLPKGTPSMVTVQYTDAAMEALKGNWKQILSNAIIKAQNQLRTKNDTVTTTQKNAIDKISNLYAEGLFDEFKDDYDNAIRKAVGVSNTNRSAMAELDDISKTANLLANSPYGANNHLAAILQQQANNIIAQARYKDANFVYKAVKTLNTIFDFVLLKTLNNPFNRTQNFLSGKVGRLNSVVTYGKTPAEIQSLGSAVKKDIVLNGGTDFGDVSNMFNGNRSSVDRVRQKVNDLLSKDGQSKITNWIYNQVMGTAALNGIDSYNKTLNTWGRFISGMEDVLVSKGKTKAEAQQLLHEQMFGKDKWKDATKKADSVINAINAKGGKIIENKQTSERFAADIIKLELVESGLITADELSATWNAGYKSAGREMGHVPNNTISKYLNLFKIQTAKEIDEAITKQDYNKASWLMVADIAVNKIALKFVGGGTNWVFLKLEKGGLGVVSAGIRRIRDRKAFSNMDRLSALTPKEIQDNLYQVQKAKDSFARGTIGLIANATFLITAIAAMNAGGEDEAKRRKRRLAEWMDKHYVASKAANAILPFYLSAYAAKIRQDKIGWNDLNSKFKKQPFVDYGLNTINQNQDFSFLAQGKKTLDVFSKNKTEQEKGFEAGGKILGNYLDLNPLPTKLIYDGINIYDEITGGVTPYTPPNYKSNTEAFLKGTLKYGLGDKVVNK